jgi:hypothetical protein
VADVVVERDREKGLIALADLDGAGIMADLANRWGDLPETSGVVDLDTRSAFTYFLARQVGFTPRQAHEIASW